MNTKKLVIATYNTIVKEYVAHDSGNPIWQPFYEKFLTFLNLKSYILDAGCGPGDAAQFFTKKGHRVFGFDLSEKMIAYAKTVAPNA